LKTIGRIVRNRKGDFLLPTWTSPRTGKGRKKWGVPGYLENLVKKKGGKSKIKEKKKMGGFDSEGEPPADTKTCPNLGVRWGSKTPGKEGKKTQLGGYTAQ